MSAQAFPAHLAHLKAGASPGESAGAFLSNFFVTMLWTGGSVDHGSVDQWISERCIIGSTIKHQSNFLL